MRKRFFLLVVSLFVFTLQSSISLASNSGLKYDISLHTTEWIKLESKEEMIKSTKLDVQKLVQLSSEELLDLVLAYPLRIDMFAYNSSQEGVDALEKQSDALKEFFTRKDAPNILLFRMKVENVKNNEDTIEKLILGRLLASEQIWTISQKKEDILREMDKANLIVVDSISSSESSTYVNTTNGTQVPVLIRGELLSYDYMIQLNNETKAAYPNAIYIAPSTTKYNCHSYAWYYASSSNSYWMNYPTSYMVDGSYNQFTNVIEANSSTRLYYNNGNHSAVVYANGGPLAGPHKLTVTSKWGELPLMRHVAEYSPYNSTGITMWRR
ncbi:MAG: hypothetical protein SCL54_14765 [Bacillota bacterium]|nr:hypothetical protein [Bacillota bacterium]